MQRIILAVVFILFSWTFARAGAEEPKGATGAENSALELRVAQLESEIDELKDLVQDLRDRLLDQVSDHPTSPLKESSANRTDTAPAADTGAAPEIAASVPQSRPDPNTIRLYWNNGIRMETANNNVSLQMGGRIQHDWGFHYDDNLNFPSSDFRDGAEFRRSRIYFSGEVGRVNFKAEYDFAGGEVGLTDVYVGLQDLGALGGLKIGHFKEPFGLEQLTSSRHLTFLERSMSSSAFAPNRNVGVMFSNSVANDRLHWAAGFFKDADGAGEAQGDGNYSFTGRLAGTPWRGGDDRLLHVGLAYSHRDAVQETLAFSTRPEAHLAPRLVTTGAFAADSENRLGIEGALQIDRFSLQSEFMQTFIDSRALQDPSLSSFYLQGSFFLTSDARAYRSSSAVYDRVKPNRSFLDGERGLGAWEIAARYSQVDLDDGFVIGGKEKNFTLGLNWYLNATSRFMFNFVHADPERSGSLNVLQTRFQIDF